MQDEIIGHFIDTLLLWHVPCFLMISGRFALDPEKGFPVIKRIKRIAASFLFWNAIYQVVFVLFGYYSGLNILGIIADTDALVGPGHFWFLWALMGLYLLTPILRIIALSISITRYFIILSFLLGIYEILAYFTPYIGIKMQTIIGFCSPGLISGYSIYFLLGYCIYKHKIIKRKTILYCIAFLGIILVALLRSRNLNVEILTSYVSPIIVLYSVVIFNAFINDIPAFSISERIEGWIVSLSSLTFGIYLSHCLFLIIFQGTIMYSQILPEMLMRILRTILVLACGSTVTLFTKKIPMIGKWVT